jgi:L-malate glycosyltransferase
MTTNTRDDEPLNVLFVHSGDLMRGSEIALLTALRGLNRRRIVPFLFTSNRELAAAAEGDGVETAVHPMPEIMIDGAHVRLQFVLWMQTVRRLASLVARRNIQVLYCNGGSTCQVGYYAAKLRGVPVVCHVHAPYDRRYVLLYRIHLASTVVSPSTAIAEGINKKQALRGQSEVIYCGVDTEGRFRPVSKRAPHWRERLSIPADVFVFGQVSSLIPRKGVDILLRAFHLVLQRHRDARLVLVGDGPQREEYRALAGELSLNGAVHFAGDQADPLPYFQHVFDVNVLATRSEALPLCLVEGAACGLAGVAANVNGVPEIVVDGQTGLLFDAEDHWMLADKMSALLREPQLCRRLGEAGRQLAVERFSLERYCRSIERTILEQVGGLPTPVVGRSADDRAPVGGGKPRNRFRRGVETQ